MQIDENVKIRVDKSAVIKRHRRYASTKIKTFTEIRKGRHIVSPFFYL